MKRFKTHMIEARMAKKNAVWVIGGAASGKSTVAETALVKGFKFTLIDVDVPFERLLKKFNVSSEIKKVSAEDKKKREAEKKAQGIKAVSMKALADPEDMFKLKKASVGSIGAVAREITSRSQESTIAAGRNLVFVETGGQIGKIKNMKKRLEGAGYKTFVVFVGVHPELDLNKKENFDKVFQIVQARGSDRQAAGGRGLDPKILERSLRVSEKVKKELLPLFKRNRLILDSANNKPRALITKTKSVISKWMKK